MNTEPPPSPPANTCRRLIAAVIGRTGAGKSTLINRLVGEKVSIVSNRTQTTRQNVRGYLSHKDCQIALTDTPGFQENPRNALNKLMNRQMAQSLREPDVLVWVADARSLLNPSSRHYDTELRTMKKMLLPHKEEAGDSSPATATAPAVVIVLNHIDRLSSPSVLLPMIGQLATLFPKAAFIPLSALRGDKIEVLLDCLVDHASEGEPLFERDHYTNQSERLMCAEILREALYAHLRQELPFSCAVVVDEFIESVNELNQPLAKLSLTIVVSQESHKPIVLGHRGEHLKRIASAARLQMEDFLGKRIFLTTFVKVIPGWQDHPRALRDLGYQ